ncbi:hypothetical protein ACEQ6C_39280, partial [Rhizobium ruizarguesonis]
MKLHLDEPPGPPPRVASYADAWIEITIATNTLAAHRVSHPTRMRGLKSVKAGDDEWLISVASYADAWIEIRLRYAKQRTDKSHP